MLNRAWKGGKKTNKPQTNRKRGCSSCLRCLLSMCFAGRYGFNFFFWCLLFGQMLVENRVEAGVGSVCLCGRQMFFLSEPPPPKKTKKHPANENRTQSHERPCCPLFSMHRHTHTYTHTQMYTSTKRARTDTNTPPWPIHLAHTSIYTVLHSNLYPALEEMQMSGRSVVPVLGVSRSFLLLLALPVPLLFSWSELR